MAPGHAKRSAVGNARRANRRADRDGDVKMGAEPKRSSRIEKKSTAAKDTTSGASGRTSTTSARRPGARGPRADLTNGRIQQRIARASANGDVNMKGGAASRPPKMGGLVEFKITGWAHSAASNADDRGKSAFEKWLESKMRRKLETHSNGVGKIKKSREDGDILYVSVGQAEARSLERMNGYQWAKTTIHIERVGGPVQGTSSQAEETKAMLQEVLERRYQAELKLLDLSALPHDPELQAHQIFETESTASKIFPAMMSVLDKAFEKPEDKHAMFDSVSLANNQLNDLKVVTSLSATLPRIKNLDLSNNNFRTIADLALWKKRFPSLQHLVVAGNPLEQNEPNFAAEFLQWYPNLMFINGTQVRTEEDIRNKTNITNLAFPIRSAVFNDEGGIGETFIRNLIVGLDTDRQGLAQFYYDNDSTFSYAVNVSAPRDPSSDAQKESGEWSDYIKSSLNLKKIGQMPARAARCFRGAEQVGAILTALPKSKHPDFADVSKWLIEAHVQTQLPDPTGQSPLGVNGLKIDIHGEFEEVDDNGQPKNKKRSVDHCILLGPALPGSAAPVRVVNHMMTIRTYGGTQALSPN
ncbi:related to mRNA export factor MEX67 [Lecanosticta acicola]|uniref:mRNA export factor MEX67 n=1 Tax=Lecanosticta acicola TaxID=111012 RepID=A0AAI8Z3M8_9PEZI|nr:related to mRNA export factor MEX67 [Lecanosticta acicola]